MGIPSYGVDYEGQYPFTQIGTITSAQAALAVTARDNASVVALAAAKKVIWSPDIGTAAAILRFRTDGTEDQAPVIEMYGAKGADYYTKIATLTLAQGTQDWSGGHFVDEITLSNEAWAHGIRADSVTDEIGRVLFNTGGFDRFLFIASTLAVTTVHIDIARLDKQINHGIEIHSQLVVIADNMTVSDVVSAISDMHSDLATGNDGLSAQLSSLMTDVEAVDNAVDLVRSTLSDTIATDLTGIQNQNSSLLTAIDGLSAQLSTLEDDVELVDAAVDAVESAVSAGLSDIVDQNSSIITELEGLSAQLSTLEDDVELVVVEVSTAISNLKTAVNLTTTEVSDAISHLESTLSDAISGLESVLSTCLEDIEADVEATNANLSGIESILDRTHISAGTPSVLWLSDIASACDGVRTAVGLVEGEVKSAADSIMANDDLIEAGIRSGVTSALSNAVSELIVNDDLNEAGIRSGVKSALIVTDSEISDAASQILANLDLNEAGIRSGIKSALIVTDVAVAAVTTAVSDMDSAVSGWFVEHETGMRSGILSALDLHETGTRSGVKSALTVTDAAISNLHSEVTAGLDFVSNGGGTEKLTIPADPFQVAGAAQVCREVIIYCPSANAGTIYLQIGAVADVNDLPLHEDVWLSIPVNNTNLLNFFGAAADVVHLLWRN